ncbi:MAG: SDR family oxidoreductase [Candidatus Hydrogenedentes bacterium]|nr:SDR family oxidoreductase [Candidatus Hydrogenedentota bacterium]
MAVLDTFSLENKVALVTGGAGLFGRQIVRALAEARATTYVASRNLEALQELAGEFAGQGLTIVPLQYDQGEEQSILALRDQVLGREGGIDVLVNNSVARPMKHGYEDSAESFAESMRVNATGLFLITRAFGDAMAGRGRGSIINIGSIQGMVGPDPLIYAGTNMSGWYPDYFFHKGGMINFTRFIASYYGACDVRCNCISPGGYETTAHPPVFVRQYSERTLLGHMAGGADLMGAVVFLASDASSYITAVNLPVDGGYTAK